MSKIEYVVQSFGHPTDMLLLERHGDGDKDGDYSVTICSGPAASVMILAEFLCKHAPEGGLFGDEEEE